MSQLEDDFYPRGGAQNQFYNNIEHHHQQQQQQQSSFRDFDYNQTSGSSYFQPSSENGSSTTTTTTAAPQPVNKLKSLRKPLPIANNLEREMIRKRLLQSNDHWIRLRISNTTGFLINHLISHEYGTRRGIVSVAPLESFEYFVTITDLMDRSDIKPIPMDDEEDFFYAKISILIPFSDANGQVYERGFTYTVKLDPQKLAEQNKTTSNFIVDASIITREQKDVEKTTTAVNTSHDILKGKHIQETRLEGLPDAGGYHKYEATLKILEPGGKQERVFGQKSGSKYNFSSF